jgi:hypothetical protein
LPLIRLAHGRSGDKGDAANIGILARRPEFVPVLARELTAEIVATYFRHLADGPVTRFELPGVGGFNFLIERALGGGGLASLRNDPQGKTFAAMLLDLEIPVPAELAALISAKSRPAPSRLPPCPSVRIMRALGESPPPSGSELLLFKALGISPTSTE